MVRGQPFVSIARNGREDDEDGLERDPVEDKLRNRGGTDLDEATRVTSKRLIEHEQIRAGVELPSSMTLHPD